MSSGYLLPCTCGKKLVITKSQAGEEVTCDCGEKLQVPTLRGLADLEIAAASNEVKVAKPRSWNPLLGIPTAILLGLSVILFGLFAYHAYWRLQIDTSYTVQDEISNGDKKLDELSPADLLTLYRSFREEGLGEKEAPPFYILLLYAKDRENDMYYFGVACACTLALGLTTGWLSKRRG